MAHEGDARGPAGASELQDLVASVDTGARSPSGLPARILAAVALAWALFQIYVASPLPFIASGATGFNLTLNATEQRAIHLAFALFLAFTAFPALSTSPRDRVPILDWVLALGGAACSLYLWVNYAALSQRPGIPTDLDIAVGVAGIVLLMEATRRALGPPLMVVALVFLAYVFFGNAAWLPEMLQWRGASLGRAISTMWLTSEGVFGVALGVSTAFVFLFVLFGSMLDRAGAGNFFIKLAFALLGHLRGGPAKAAVLASLMTGLISGSSIANVVTTGTFTIPLMKRVGFKAEKAGAVEVSASVNGQIMPPVMGAAAFLMVEFVGIPYVDVIRHAFLPAVITYITLLYVVHLEAVRGGMQVIPKRIHHPAHIALLRSGLVITSVLILAGAVYFAIAAVRAVLPDVSTPVLLGALGAVYLGLVWYASKVPELELDDPNAPVVELPVATEVLKTGLYYLLPLFVLVWFLMVERRSPGLSVFYAVSLLIVIMLTQRPLKALFRGARDWGAQAREGWDDLIAGLITGARNMIGIACATAAAGIIVGTVTLTGIGQVMAEFVEFLSGGNIFLILVFTAIFCLIIGMGLPTTANYIVVSSLMAPVIVELAPANGVIIPLIAAHMFVFYFGLTADVTPPVGLASFAASAISGADPIRTGITAAFYEMRTALLPFIFVFNTDLLLIDVTWVEGISVAVLATVAMLLFAAATQGWFIVRSRYWESAALLLVTFILLRPGFFLDQIQPPWQSLPPETLFEVAETVPEGQAIRLRIVGPDFYEPEAMNERLMAFPMGPAGEPGDIRFENATGLAVVPMDGAMTVEEPFDINSTAARALADMDFYGDPPVTIQEVQVTADQLPRQVMYIPAFLLLGLVWLLQARRAGTANPFTA